MPLASSSRPFCKAAAAADVNLGEIPVGPRPKNDPPPEAIHNPDQSGNWANGGDCCPPWAAVFRAVYSSDAVLYLRPISNICCHSLCARLCVRTAEIAHAASINRRAGDFFTCTMAEVLRSILTALEGLTVVRPARGGRPPCSPPAPP